MFGFQSTPSGGKATHVGACCAECAGVSIHAFRGEGDVVVDQQTHRQQRFQSTPSGGKATCPTICAISHVTVSIHAFRGEGDHRMPLSSILFVVSIHAFRGEGDPSSNPHDPTQARFQSTPSGGKATPRHRINGVQEQFQSTPSGGKATLLCYGILST